MTNKRSLFPYTSNCIICGKEFSSMSHRKNSKRRTCGNHECISRLRTTSYFVNHPKDDESAEKRLRDRLNKKILKQDNGCAFWTGCLNACGYGTTGFCGKNKLVHRLIYELHYGPIPIGMEIAHKCDCRNCCEISHLFLTDHKGNMTDMVNKGRSVSAMKGKCHTQEAIEKIKKSQIGKKFIRDTKLKCKFCGNEFIGGKTQIFCCYLCKDRNHKQKKRIIANNQ